MALSPRPGHLSVHASDAATLDEASGSSDADLRASDVAWDLEPLVDGKGADGVEAQLEIATNAAERVGMCRGTVASLDGDGIASMYRDLAEVYEALGRAGNYASLKFTVDTNDAGIANLMQATQERSSRIGSELVFVELEWAEVSDERVDELLADPALDFCAHHLRSMRRYRPHLLTEPEEKLLVEKSVSGASAWVRLFDELTSAIEIDLAPLPSHGAEASTSSAGAESSDDQGEPETFRTGMAEGLTRLSHPDRAVRAEAAAAVTEGLRPGLKTRGYILNTIASDHSIDDRLRGHDHWLSSRNLANEASDESVQALVDAVVARYDIPQRWYALKAEMLGIDKLADYDRMASVADTDAEIGWDEATELVLGAYESFSPELAETGRRFFDENWIDAPTRPGKRQGAFCAYTVPSHHPYLLLNWTGRRRDVLTLAHELGHGLHAQLARPQGVFHQTTPLTLAETASVFGETVTFGRLLDATTEPAARLGLLASQLEDSIATVFRQTAMNRFEHEIHTGRREQGELSVERIGELWIETQSEMLGDAVELTEDYSMWWSYIPHFIGTPGYVYAYAYGQLLALSVYRRYTEQGPEFVPDYLEMLAAGGSLPPHELGHLVGCDLADPEFWNGGLDIIASQLDATIEAAAAVS